jgi:hypothetical protein
MHRGAERILATGPDDFPDGPTYRAALRRFCVLSDLLGGPSSGTVAVAEATKIARKVDSWMTLANALFDPEGGILARYFPKAEERQAFLRSPEYQQINKLLLQTMARTGLLPNPVTRKSGKFMARLPKALHTALEVEAENEGVSLNQLAATKLTVGLRESVGFPASVAEAFRKVHDGHSTERVVVDPELNARFIQACRELDLAQSEYQLNHTLFRPAQEQESPAAPDHETDEIRRLRPLRVCQ